jgi:hypothetical protein
LTNSSVQDENWAEFSTVEVAAFVPCALAVVKQNCFNLKLKTWPKLVLDYLPLDITLPNGTAHIKNVNNCWNANFSFYVETSGGQSSNLYLNVHFLTPVLIRHLWQLKTVFSCIGVVLLD